MKTAVPAMTFGVSEFTTWPWSFEQDIDHYSRLGVEAIEVCEFKLDSSLITQQLEIVGEAGLRISSAQPKVRTLFPSKSQPDPKRVSERMEMFRDSIRMFGRHAAGVPFVTNTGIPPEGNMHMVMETAVEEYRRLSEFAAECGALVALEPLNPSIMNLESSVWTIEQAQEIIARVDRDNFGLCLDYWNVWQNPNVVNAIFRAGPSISVVQVSDWRTPRSDQDRLIPGEGVIPLAQLLAATRDGGFDGVYSVEIFSGNVADSVWDRDLETVIRQSREGMARAWNESFDEAPLGGLE